MERPQHNLTLDRARPLTVRLRISTAANAEVACYAVLRASGFAVRREELAGADCWIAERGELELSSTEGLCALLGLAGLIAQRGAAWHATDEETDEFVRRFLD